MYETNTFNRKAELFVAFRVCRSAGAEPGLFDPLYLLFPGLDSLQSVCKHPYIISMKISTSFGIILV